MWFIGYTPHAAAAAMIGGANQFGTPIPLAGQTVGGVYIYSASGSGFAAPIWGDAMRIITAGAPYEDFVYPSGVEGAGVTSIPKPKPPKGPKGPRGPGARERQRPQAAVRNSQPSSRRTSTRPFAVGPADDLRLETPITLPVPPSPRRRRRPVRWRR